MSTENSIENTASPQTEDPIIPLEVELTVKDTNMDEPQPTEEENQQNYEIELKDEPNEIKTEAFEYPPIPEETGFQDVLESVQIGNRQFRSRNVAPKVYKEKEVKIKSRSRYDSQDSYDCSECVSTFPTKTGLLNHMRKHKKPTHYNCSICQEIFNTNDDLKKHKIEHKNMTFTCDKCCLAFTDHCEYLIHEVKHTQRTLYRCFECTSYFNKKSLLTHLDVHFDRLIKCEKCNKMVRIKNLNNHLRAHELVNCVECGKDIHADYMNRHMLGHTQVKRFQCLYCAKAFISKTSCDIHTRIHTNDRPYECKICHQRFFQYTDQKRHTQTHSLEKEYQCDICQKKFRHKESLKSHISVHMRTEKYKCEICNKGISTKPGYTKHMAYKHSDEKLFECVPCNLKFKLKYDVVKHCRSIKHKNNLFGYKLKKEGSTKDD